MVEWTRWKLLRNLERVINSLISQPLTETEVGVDNFRLLYRIASHSTTHKSSVLESSNLRTNLKCRDPAEVTYFEGHDQRPIPVTVLPKIDTV